MFLALLLPVAVVSLETHHISARCGEIQCPENWIYYFDCCVDECCLRLQPIPAVVLGLFAAIVTIGIVYAIVCFLCCRKP